MEYQEPNAKGKVSRKAKPAKKAKNPSATTTKPRTSKKPSQKGKGLVEAGFPLAFVVLKKMLENHVKTTKKIVDSQKEKQPSTKPKRSIKK